MLAFKHKLCKVICLQKYTLPESQAEFPLTTLNIHHCDLFSQMADAESHNKHNMCFSSKNIEKKLFLHGTKVILILFTELN